MPVDEDHADPAPAKLVGEHEPGGTGSDDEDVRFHA
jgi:hypothetical protein